MPNQLVLHIQPEEGISLRFACQGPRRPDALGQRRHDFEYADYFGVQPSTGYETPAARLHDRRRHAFPRADMVEAGWCVVSPVLDVWKGAAAEKLSQLCLRYLGPREADDLLERDGRR